MPRRAASKQLPPRQQLAAFRCYAAEWSSAQRCSFFCTALDEDADRAPGGRARVSADYERSVSGAFLWAGEHTRCRAPLSLLSYSNIHKFTHPPSRCTRAYLHMYTHVAPHNTHISTRHSKPLPHPAVICVSPLSHMFVCVCLSYLCIRLCACA